MLARPDSSHGQRGQHDRAVASLYAARAREEALELNRAGRYEEAQRRLQATAARIRTYAGGDRVLNQILEDLGERHVMYAQVLSAPALKQERYSSYNVARMRAPDGKARRRPDTP